MYQYARKVSYHLQNLADDSNIPRYFTHNSQTSKYDLNHENRGSPISKEQRIFTRI